MATTDIDVIDVSASTLRDEIVALVEGKQDMYSSLKADTFEGRIELLGAVTDAAKISDNVGVPIALRHIVVQAVDLVDAQTGEVTTAPRVVLIDDKGQAFYGISEGLYRSVSTFIKLAGDPGDWPEPLKVVVTREGPSTRSYFTMKLAPKSTKK